MAHQKNVLVIFDLVSTLADAGPRYVQAFTETCEKNGYGTPDREEIMAMLGNKNLSEIIDHFAGPMPESGKKDFMAACNQTCDALLCRPSWREELYPYAREAIKELHARGASLGIYTGTREDAMEQQLAYHDIKREFDPRYIRGKDNNRDAGKKNSALKLEQLESIVAAYRTDCGADAPVIVIGDSASDAKAAEQFGLFFIGFALNDRKMAELETASVKIVVQHFADLPSLVDRLLMPDQISRLIKPPANDNRLLPGVRLASGVVLYKNQI